MHINYLISSQLTMGLVMDGIREGLKAKWIAFLRFLKMVTEGLARTGPPSHTNLASWRINKVAYWFDRHRPGSIGTRTVHLLQLSKIYVFTKIYYSCGSNGYPTWLLSQQHTLTTLWYPQTINLTKLNLPTKTQQYT